MATVWSGFTTLGPPNNQFDNPKNWSKGVPGSADSGVIPAFSGFIESNSDVTVGGLVVNPGDDVYVGKRRH